ncbi:MutH/Sau3AI family endonuclease [Anaerovorax odorimutans]|uniref:MutH/Sau3AI family endonuclease n=1 Tax=Anaerovorax odorimutans TaxID=109327 RepID=UPI00040121AE|nr:MutH/Sau3AI family endonuclease [Anaerovorax odorimutans]
MKLLDAEARIKKFVNKPFKEYLSPDKLHDAIVNKGRTGQLLELTIGLGLSNTTLDFEDGELKTNKCDKFGNPKETMFITQTSSIIDDLLSEKDFYSSKLYNKLKNILYVPISKDGPVSDWMYLPCIHINLESPPYRALKEQLELDYYSICQQLNQHIRTSPDGFIHTSNGKFMQIRSKDSKPYSPIYSTTYGRKVSNKNHAFYFKKEFMKYIVSLN